MRRVLLIAGLAVGSLMNAGCGDSSTAPTTASIAGTYNLKTVNGSPLPFVLLASPKVEILNGQVTVSSNGTWTGSGTLRTTSGTSVTMQTQTSAGTYTVNGTAAVFKDNTNNTTFAVTVSGNSLLFTESGFSYVYTR